MLTHDYSYDACLKGSVTQVWTGEDCFRGRDFDFDKPLLDRNRGAGTRRLNTTPSVGNHVYSNGEQPCPSGTDPQPSPA